MKCLLALAAGCVAVFTVACADKPTSPDLPLQFNQDRITQGEAEAVLHAFQPAGLLILSKNGVAPDGSEPPPVDDLQAAPADILGSNGAIRPTPFFDGRRYCTLDWLVPQMGVLAGAPVGTPLIPVMEIRDYLTRITITMSLDSQPFPTIASPIVRVQGFVDWGIGQNAYGHGVGNIVGPGALSVGAHTLGSDWYFNGAYWFSTQATFHIDDAASATCAG